MKSMGSGFFYISLAIALYSPNVSTHCGNDEQIDDLKMALLTQESAYTVLTTLSAIPVTGATLAFAQMLMSGRFALHLNEVFEEMESSLNMNHTEYGRCQKNIEDAITSNTVLKPTSFGFALTAFIPGIGMTLLAPRLYTSIATMLLIRQRLEFWQDNGCQYATTRDCNL